MYSRVNNMSNNADSLASPLPVISLSDVSRKRISGGGPTACPGTSSAPSFPSTSEPAYPAYAPLNNTGSGQSEGRKIPFRRRRWSLTDSPTRLSPIPSNKVAMRPKPVSSASSAHRSRKRRVSDPGGWANSNLLCPIVGVSPHRQTSILDCDIQEEDETINFPSSDISDGRLRSPRRSVISSPRQRSNSLPAEAEADFRALFEVGEALGALLLTSTSTSHSGSPKSPSHSPIPSPITTQCGGLQVLEESGNRRRSSVSLESCSLASISEENNITQAMLIPIRPSTYSTSCSSAVSSLYSSDDEEEEVMERHHHLQRGDRDYDEEVEPSERHASRGEEQQPVGHAPLHKLHNTVVSRNLRRCHGDRRNSSPDVAVPSRRHDNLISE